MIIEYFWKIIDTINIDWPDMETSCERLGRELRKLPAEEIQSFNDHFAACLHQANTVLILDATEILLGKEVSKEEFEVYRSVIVSFGRKRFETILSAPYSLDNKIRDCSDVYNKLFGQIARHVYEEKTKKKLEPSKLYPEAPSGPKLNAVDHPLSYVYLHDHSSQVSDRQTIVKERRKAEIQRQKESEVERKLLKDVTAEKIKLAKRTCAFGESKLRKRDLDGAIALFTQAIEANPAFADAYVKRGMAKFEKGDTAGAIADYTKAIEIKPRCIDAYRKRITARNHAQDWVGVLTDRDKATELSESKAAESPNQELLDREWQECYKRWVAMDLDSYTTYKLPLSFVFTLPTLEAAEKLKQGGQELKGCQVKVYEKDIPGYRTWRVECSAQKRLKDPGDLMEWVIEMMDLGLEFGCVSGGWGFADFDFEPIASPERLKEIEESGDGLDGADPEDDEDGFKGG